MYIKNNPRKGLQYFSIVEGKRCLDYVSHNTVLYLGRLDNITDVRRLELERKIHGLGDPYLITKFRSLLYSLGYVFPHPFSDMTVEAVYDLGRPLAFHKICEDIQLVDIVNKHGYKGGGLPIGKLVEIMAIHRNCNPGSHRDLVRWYPTTTLPGYISLPAWKLNYKVTLNALEYLQPNHTIPMQVELYDNIQAVYGYKCNRLDIDLTSTYFEGVKCLLAKAGYSRDHRFDREQIVIGFVVDQEGVLVTHKVWPGNRTDAKSLKPIDQILRIEFDLDCQRVVDRGIATWENIKYMDRKKEHYLVALRAEVKSTGLLDDIKIPRSKWEEVDDGEYAASVIRGRRKYVVLFNDSLARRKRRTRLSKVKKAEGDLKIVQKRILDGNIKSENERDEEIGHILKKHTVKSFIEVKRDKLDIGFSFARAAKLDEANKYLGYQVFVTTEKHLTEREIVLSYRIRDEVEKAIDCLKNALDLRPIYVWTKEHVIGQIYICAQAYQLRSIMALELKRSDIGMGLDEALWNLQRLNAVNIIVTGDEIRVFSKLSTMDKNQIALVDIFNMRDSNGDIPGVDAGI